jgi:hypothetical protein
VRRAARWAPAGAAARVWARFAARTGNRAARRCTRSASQGGSARTPLERSWTARSHGTPSGRGKTLPPSSNPVSSTVWPISMQAERLASERGCTLGGHGAVRRRREQKEPRLEKRFSAAVTWSHALRRGRSTSAPQSQSHAVRNLITSLSDAAGLGGGWVGIRARQSNATTDQGPVTPVKRRGSVITGLTGHCAESVSADADVHNTTVPHTTQLSAQAHYPPTTGRHSATWHVTWPPPPRSPLPLPSALSAISLHVPLPQKMLLNCLQINVVRYAQWFDALLRRMLAQGLQTAN